MRWRRNRKLFGLIAVAGSSSWSWPLASADRRGHLERAHRRRRRTTRTTSTARSTSGTQRAPYDRGELRPGGLRRHHRDVPIRGRQDLHRGDITIDGTKIAPVGSGLRATRRCSRSVDVRGERSSVAAVKRLPRRAGVPRRSSASPRAGRRSPADRVRPARRLRNNSRRVSFPEAASRAAAGRQRG